MSFYKERQKLTAKLGHEPCLEEIMEYVKKTYSYHAFSQYRMHALAIAHAEPDDELDFGTVYMQDYIKRLTNTTVYPTCHIKGIVTKLFQLMREDLKKGRTIVLTGLFTVQLTSYGLEVIKAREAKINTGGVK